MMIRILLAVVWLSLSIGSAHSADNSSDPGKGQQPNRLLNEASPYLRQHAYNPVDWYPWGAEAFAKAKRENKPILLSVGYSTCHWCHVMAHESYENTEIAKLLNEHFVAIKVDRERRPDVDETYILATQLITGGAGWPNNVFLTSDLKPFMGGTYFPPEDFKNLLLQIIKGWQNDRKLIEADGTQLANLIARVMNRRVAAKAITRPILAAITKKTVQQFDALHGGLGTQPKFPRENLLLLLLDEAEKHGDKAALQAALGTLDAMIQGGIHDQVGGGFHRYTLDRKWIIPHFEKMLYTQAQTGRALIQAYRLTAKPRYKNAARALFSFVARDMTSPNGGFYAAFDADSKTLDGELEEGSFYVWTQDQLQAVLGATDAAIAEKLFGTSFEGNFSSSNILYLATPMHEVAKLHNLSLAGLHQRLAKIKTTLRIARSRRAAPHRDEKILTAWNGLMIKTLSEASIALADQGYLTTALKTAEFFWQKMGAAKGALRRYHYDGVGVLAATQQDYVFLALGYVALYDASQDAVWLKRAEVIAARMNELFRDKARGDYFMSFETTGFHRPKLAMDGNIPAGNAAALELFAKLARRRLNLAHRTSAELLLAALSGLALTQPTGHAYSLRAADELLRGETGSLQYLSKGNVRAIARLESDGAAIKVTLNIKQGWHINAHNPLEPYFIPTKLDVYQIGGVTGAQLSVRYPAPMNRKLSFNEKPLALYEGKVILRADINKSKPVPQTVSLTAQACSDKICLEPETVTLRVLR